METLGPGQPCPLDCGGKLYLIAPGIIVNIKGHNLASVNKYWIEKLRCALCNEVFSATIPKQICKEKYHPSFKAMLVLQKYYMAMPFHRQEYFQSLIGFPLAASTQWQLIEELACCALMVFPVLEKIAANGSLIHNDDTVVRIVDVIHKNGQNPGQKRTGICIPLAFWLKMMLIKSPCFITANAIQVKTWSDCSIGEIRIKDKLSRCVMRWVITSQKTTTPSFATAYRMAFVNLKN